MCTTSGSQNEPCCQKAPTSGPDIPTPTPQLPLFFFFWGGGGGGAPSSGLNVLGPWDVSYFLSGSGEEHVSEGVKGHPRVEPTLGLPPSLEASKASRLEWPQLGVEVKLSLSFFFFFVSFFFFFGGGGSDLTVHCG